MKPLATQLLAGVAGGAVVLLGQAVLRPGAPPAEAPPPAAEIAAPAEPAVSAVPVLLGDLPPGAAILATTPEACPQGWSVADALITASGATGGGVLIVVGGSSESPSYHVCVNG
jgi:hypothetical protein